MLQKVTDSKKIVTDPEMLRELVRQGIDKDYVEFHEDYTTEHPSAKFYRDLKSGKRFMVVSGLPKVEDTGRKIEVGWLLAKGKYCSKANLFSAVVEGTEVRVGLKLVNVTWNPQVFLKGEEQTRHAIPKLLKKDPYNENYHDNVLEWNYGFCKRRLRIIEGALLERWVLDKDPKGEVRIKHNTEGDLSLVGMVDAEGNRFGQVIGDEEVISKEDFGKAIYPVEIFGSLTVYSTSSDGTVDYGYSSSNYPTVHDGVGEIYSSSQEFIYTANDVYLGNFNCYRGFLYFTHGLVPDDTVIAAILSLYGKSSQEADSGHSDVLIVEGIQSDPFVLADYQNHLNKTTPGSDTPYAYPMVEDAYNDKALNSTGIGWVQTAVTGGASVKFCLRSWGDADSGGHEPTGRNIVTFWSNEKGAGFQPKLVITYTPGVTEKTSSDTGSGVDALAGRGIELPEVETGSGAEALDSRLLGTVEEGGGAETLLARLLASAETASGVEVGAIFFSSSDVGSGLDTILVLQALLTGADSGSGTDDIASLIKALLATDSGLGTDAVAALLATIIAGELMVGSDCLVVKIESAPRGGDMRLPPGGKTSIPSRRVNL